MLSASNHDICLHSSVDSLCFLFPIFHAFTYPQKVKRHQPGLNVFSYSLMCYYLHEEHDRSFFLLYFSASASVLCSSFLFAPITRPQIGHLYSNVFTLFLTLFISLPHLGHFILFPLFYLLSHYPFCMVHGCSFNFFTILINLLLTMVHHFDIVKLQGGSPSRISSLKNTYTKPQALKHSASVVIICEDVYRSYVSSFSYSFYG